MGVFEIPVDFFTFYSTRSQGYQVIENFKSLFPKLEMKNLIITDGTAGIGGNSIFFCKHFKNVNCVEVNNKVHKTLVKNLKDYTNKRIFNQNYIEIFQSLKQDVIFLDPPWGEEYIDTKVNNEEIGLYLSGFNLNHLISILYDYSKIVILKAPINFKFKFVNNWKTKKFLVYSNKKVVYYLYFYYKENA